MRNIRVDPNATIAPSYPTAAEAIRAETGTLRAKRAGADTPRIAGAVLEGFVISDQLVSLRLSNGLVLDVSVTDGVVEWSIAPPQGDTCWDSTTQQAPVDLVWPDGDHSTWNPGGLLQERRPFPVSRIFAGGTYLNVYFKRGGAIRFSPLWSPSEQATLVYCDELEPVKGAPAQRPVDGSEAEEKAKDDTAGD